jgi:hypothetical protein
VFRLNAVPTRSDDKEMYFTNITKEVISIVQRLQGCRGLGSVWAPFVVSHEIETHTEGATDNDKVSVILLLPY